MLGRLNHVAIAVPDLERGTGVYRTMLGAKVSAPQAEPAHGVTVVFVELPAVGRAVDAGDPTAVVESVKAASDIYAPVGGEVVEVNPAVEADPSLVNTDPYGKGWIFKLRVKNAADVSSLMDAAAYQTHIS